MNKVITPKFKIWIEDQDGEKHEVACFFSDEQERWLAMLKKDAVRVYLEGES
jgi:hypothetical protein